MDRNLVIAVGNVARGDDGVAHHVAGLLLERGLPDDTRLMTAVGLDVAMAADVAEAGSLFVIDADRRDAPAVQVSEIESGTAAHSGHAIDAPGLLAVTYVLYATSPRARLVSVAAPDMGHGEELSGTARAASEEAARVILDLLHGA